MTGLDLEFGRYAAYVWPAFGVTAAVLGALVIDSLWRGRRWKRELERLEAERQS